MINRKPTHIVRQIDTAPLLAEMVRFSEFSKPHHDSLMYLQHGPLRHGSSAWLKTEDASDFHRRAEFPACIQVAEAFADEHGTTVARSYIHCMPPGSGIDKHQDVGEAYHYSIQRYQIYLNWPAGAVLNHEGEFGPNAIIWFNAFNEHEYINGSSENWYLMVFDLKVTNVLGKTPGT